MDQDAFRSLLASGRQSQPNTSQGAPAAANDTLRKATTSESSQPAFKPRKVKKTESKYRNRAAERRDGTGNDYAQVEAILEDFQKRVAHEDKDIVEQQRKYLGGDSEHTILVKGLDMSLLEQNRARVAVSAEDDEVLEQAFAQAASTSQPTETRKRTREDIIRDLKAKQQSRIESSHEPVTEESSREDASTFEAARKAGKFKPIGQAGEISKKRGVAESKEGVKKKKKKKRNVDSAPVEPETKNEPVETTADASQERDTIEASSSKMPQKLPEPESAPLDEDYDIFTGAGDYEGFPGDESDEEHHGGEEISQEALSAVPAAGAKNWFDEPEPDGEPASVPPEKSPLMSETLAAEEPLRLKPLESSALPSIRDFLAMDEAAERAGKRKARKEKKKKKKKGAGDDDDDDD